MSTHLSLDAPCIVDHYPLSTRTPCVRLSVCYNNIGTEGLLSLAAAMKVTSTLSHIYIWGNHLEEPVCQASSHNLAEM